MQVANMKCLFTPANAEAEQWYTEYRNSSDYQRHLFIRVMCIIHFSLLATKALFKKMGYSFEYLTKFSIPTHNAVSSTSLYSEQMKP